MRRAMIAGLAALLAACGARETSSTAPSPGAADAAGNRLVSLAAQADGRRCHDDWCVNAGADIAPSFERDGATHLLAPAQQAMPAPWDNAIVQADGAVLFGLVDTRTVMYSGGGASASALTLYRAAPGQAPVEVGLLPFGGEAEIRACFSDADVAARLQACADQYDFMAEISLDAANADGAPRLVLQTQAQTFPGRRSRSEDSLAQGPLSEADLTHWNDPVCSYTRTFSLGADGRYAPNEPLPPCSDYLEP